jgi:hypothetical protein
MPDVPNTQLVAGLRELGLRLQPDDTADPVAAAVVRIRSAPATVRLGSGRLPRLPAAPRSWRPARLAVAAAVALVTLVVVLALPGPRGAVARLLGIGGVRVTYTGQVPVGLEQELDLGRPVTPAEARQLAERPLAAPARLGEPAGAYIGRPPGAVTFVWAPGPDLPEVGDTGVGLLLTVLPGTTDAGLVSKAIGPGTTIELVRVRDGAAYWIAGAPHELHITARDGDIVIDSSRLAGNTLLWTEDGVTYRLESALGREEAVDLADDLRPR